MSFLDLLIPCPYDRAHMIYESKMQSHLFKCERNNRNINKVVCPFNSTHRVDKIEYMLHINSCTNRQVIEGHKYDIDGVQIFQPQPYIEPKLPPQEENWDEEPPCETYDPSIHTESSCVLRKPVGVSKSQRKVFYKREIQRIGRIQDIEKEDSEDLKTDENLQSGSVDSEDLQEKTRGVSVTDEYVKFSINPSLGLGRGTTFRNKSPLSETRPGINNIVESPRSSVPVSSKRINGQRGLLFSLSPLKETVNFCKSVAESISRKEYSNVVKTK